MKDEKRADAEPPKLREKAAASRVNGVRMKLRWCAEHNSS
jgi:hypothetical protein